MSKGYFYIIGTICLTVYGLLAIKSQMARVGGLPGGIFLKVIFLTKLMLFNPWVFSGIVAGYGAGLCWMMVMTEFELNHAYPFLGLNFILVLIMSHFIFGESINLAKVIGTLLVTVGIIIASKGS